MLNQHLGRPENCLPRAWGGDFQKWAPMPGLLFCARTVVGSKTAGIQILARKKFFHSKIFPQICVAKMISLMWGSFEAMYVGVVPAPPPSARQ